MERNTFATSTYIETTPEAAFDYLKDLRNLDEWTLYSRMIEQIDANTWRGTASGYQHDLFYHVRPIETPLFKGVEWHCGFEYDKYFQCYPAVVFPAAYLGSNEPGVYFHWLSFVGPERQTQMIMQGIDYVHTAEIRSLKGALERQAGLREAARGRFEVETASIFVDAPLDLAVDYLSDVRNFRAWAFFIRGGDAADAREGTFVDEYGREVKVRCRVHDLENYALLEHELAYEDEGYVQRSCMFLVPCAYAFGNPKAQGLVQHRVFFFEGGQPPRLGKLQVQDYGAECMALKRVLENKAGNLTSFNRGMSYLGETV